ncbi:MAG: MerR family transcriptional regulator [Spirochaetales bacterium]|nr:MerR family transcriptional regulator [Spirochaetales bacterium]
MRRYTIQDVAQLHQVSKKALLYYEQKGLFFPSLVDDRTAYRYYTADQFSLLKTIVFFRNLGIPIGEIKEYVDQRGSEGAIRFLEKQLLRIGRESEKLDVAKKALSEQLSVYKLAASLDERHLEHVSFRREEERRVCFDFCENLPGGEEILLTYRRVVNLLNQRGLPVSRKYGDVYFQEGFENNVLDHVGVFSEVPWNTVEDESIKVFPEGMYACMYKLGGYPDASAVALFFDQIKNRGFRVKSDLLAFALLDYGDVKTEEKMLYEFQILVE